MNSNKKHNSLPLDDSFARNLTSSRFGWSHDVPSNEVRPSFSSPLDNVHRLPNASKPIPNVQASQDALSLDISTTSWILEESQTRGIMVTGVEFGETGIWRPCHPSNLLSRIQTSPCSAWIAQRPSCSGVRTSVIFTEMGKIWGAWWVDKKRREPENPHWRSLLLEALVIGCRTAIP